jgi:MerR family copper efflux transcriptional regulator
MAILMERHQCPKLKGEAMLRLGTNAMTIGQLSRRSGVSIKSLREYERLGFLYTLGRSESNYRLFGEETLWCVRAVQGLRSLGLTLKEIQDLLQRYVEDAERPYLPLGDFLDVPLVQMLTRVEARIADLEALRQRILEFQATYSTGTDERVVPAFAASLAHLFEAGPCHICASSAS